MEPELKRFLQIGIIVRNVEDVVKNYEEMGMGPWEITTMRNDVPPFDDLTFDGKELSKKGPIMKTAMLNCFGFEIELIEPIADTVYMQWLNEHGPGLHHLAFDTKTDNETFLERCNKKTGQEPWVQGLGMGGLMNFSYVDLREELGMIIECYGKIRPGKPALPYDTKSELVE